MIEGTGYLTLQVWIFPDAKASPGTNLPLRCEWSGNTHLFRFSSRLPSSLDVASLSLICASFKWTSFTIDQTKTQLCTSLDRITVSYVWMLLLLTLELFSSFKYWILLVLIFWNIFNWIYIHRYVAAPLAASQGASTTTTSTGFPGRLTPSPDLSTFHDITISTGFSTSLTLSDRLT